MQPKRYIDPNFEPAKAALEVLADLEDLRDRLNRMAETVHTQGLMIERHRLELVRIRRDMIRAPIPAPRPS
jgi:hypothetical protein